MSTFAKFLLEDYDTLDTVFRYSASQLKTFRACARKWYFQSVMGRKVDPGAGAALGTEIHSQLEQWLRNKTLPTHDAAIALLPLLPHPHEKMRVEHEFSLFTKSGTVRGFIDLYLPDAVGVVLPDNQPTNLPRVYDHKTTSRLDYALSEKELESDPQAILYGLEARRFAKTLEDVVLVWNYTQTKGKRAVRPVGVRQTRSMFEDGFSVILDDAGKMRTIAEADCSVTDVPFDTKECTAYGGCPYKDDCGAYSARILGLSVMDRLDAITVGAYDSGDKERKNMGFLEELAARANAPFDLPKDPAPAPLEAPPPAATVTPEPTEMPPIAVVTEATSSVLPPEIFRPKKQKRVKEGETLSVEALVRQALTAAVETDNLHVMAVLSGLLRDINTPRAT